MSDHGRTFRRFCIASALGVGVLLVVTAARLVAPSPTDPVSAIWPAVVALVGAAVIPPALLLAVTAPDRKLRTSNPDPEAKNG